MKYNIFAVITSIIVITIMFASTITMGPLNILQINNVSAQNQSSSNTVHSSQGLPMKPTNGAIITNQSSTTTTVPNFTGSIPIFQPIINGFKSSIHVSLNDAIKTAEKSIGNNSTAIAAFIHPEREFIVYNVFALDSNNNVHRVIVDPGNGKILSSQQMSFTEMMLLVHGGLNRGNGMMMNPGMGINK